MIQVLIESTNFMTFKPRFTQQILLLEHYRPQKINF